MKLTNILTNYVAIPVIALSQLTACETLQRKDTNAEAIVGSTIYTKATNLKDGTTKIGQAGELKYSPSTLNTMYANKVYVLPDHLAVRYNLCKDDDCRLTQIRAGLAEQNITQKGLEYDVLNYIQRSVAQDQEVWKSGMYAREAGRTATLIILLGLIGGKEAAAANQTKQATGTVGAGSSNTVGSSVLRGVVTPVGPAPMPWRP